MKKLIEILVEGEIADIYVYAGHRGKSPALEFIRSLGKAEKHKVFALINRFAANGEIRNNEQFRVEDSPICAFKSFQVRVLCFLLPRASKKSLVLTHGFKKKSPKMNPVELEKARRIFEEVVNAQLT